MQLDGKSIHDVLEMTVSEAIDFSTELGGAKNVAARLRVLERGRPRLPALGQPLNVLSGGESQRLKLVEQLTNQKRNELRC